MVSWSSFRRASCVCCFAYEVGFLPDIPREVSPRANGAVGFLLEMFLWREIEKGISLREPTAVGTLNPTLPCLILPPIPKKCRPFCTRRYFFFYRMEYMYGN